MIDNTPSVLHPPWPCSLGDRGADARKRAEWAWCSWSTGWIQVCNVPAVHIKARFMAHKFSTGWAVDVAKSVEKKKSLAGQFAVKYKSETPRGRLRLRFLTCWLSSMVTTLSEPTTANSEVIWYLMMSYICIFQLFSGREASCVSIHTSTTRQSIFIRLLLCMIRFNCHPVLKALPTLKESLLCILLALCTKMKEASFA